MTPQEEQLLNSLVERVNQTQLQEKDPDAEALLNRAFGPNPDAHYILAQTVLVQNIALEQAKAQVAQLQQQIAQAQQQAQPARATSFLGGLLGHHDPPPQQPPSSQQAYTPVAQAQPTYGQNAPGYQPVTQPGYAPVSQPQYMPAGQPQFVPVGGGQPSFMRGAMQTAAGVAAGALAFEGVESVLHGIGGMGHPGYGWGGMGGGFGGGGMMGAGLERPAEETVINNYYDQPGEHGGIEHGAGDHPWHEAGTQVADQGGAQDQGDTYDQGGAKFENASYNTGGDDRESVDTGNADTGNAGDGNTDGSGFDDGGSDSGSGSDDGGGGFDDGGGGFGGDDGGGGGY